MAKRGNVFLVGPMGAGKSTPMGAGKSTIGRQLAHALGFEFVDCDHAIEQQTGARIALIFDIEGEEGFRKREAAMIDHLSTRDGIVLATGGGAVLDPANRSHLHGRGTVVYLACSVAQQFERTRHSKHRPKLAALLEVRDPLYQEVAHMVVDTDHRSVGAVVKELVRRLKPMLDSGQHGAEIEAPDPTTQGH
jgi:shikimate kinase